MSRRRFFNAESTYSTFIHGIEDHKSNRPLLPNKHDYNYGAIIEENLQKPKKIIKTTAEEPTNITDSSYLLDEAQIKRDNIDVWLSRRNLDDIVRRKTLYINLNAFLGIIIMIAMNEFCWNGVKCIDNYISKLLGICCTLSTAGLIYQLLDRKKLQLSIKFREKRRKVKDLKAPLAKVSFWGLLSLRPTQFRWKLWLQILVCAIHPQPYLNELTEGYWPLEVGLIMFLRFHLIFRLIRDYSDIWLNRRSIKKIAAFARTPNFDWWLAIKTVCYRQPVKFIIYCYFLSVLICGYGLYIFEREPQPDDFNFPISLFVSFECVSLFWSDDVYEEHSPITWGGRFVCIFGAILGSLLTSFIIGMIAQQIRPSKFEESALNWVSVEHIRLQERDLAARLIQYVWRNYQHEKELKEKLAKKNPRLYDQISEQTEKEFMEEFLTRCKALRNIRRERVELEEQLDPTSEKNISPVDQLLEERLEQTRNEVFNMNMKQEEALNRLEGLLKILVKNQTKEKKERRKKLKSAAASATANNNTNNNTKEQNLIIEQQQASTQTNLPLFSASTSGYTELKDLERERWSRNNLATDEGDIKHDSDKSDRSELRYTENNNNNNTNNNQQLIPLPYNISSAPISIPPHISTLSSTLPSSSFPASSLEQQVESDISLSQATDDESHNYRININELQREQALRERLQRDFDRRHYDYYEMYDTELKQKQQRQREIESLGRSLTGTSLAANEFNEEERERLAAGINLRSALRWADREREERRRRKVQTAELAAIEAGLDPTQLSPIQISDSELFTQNEQDYLEELRRKYFTKAKSNTSATAYSLSERDRGNSGNNNAASILARRRNSRDLSNINSAVSSSSASSSNNNSSRVPQSMNSQLNRANIERSATYTRASRDRNTESRSHKKSSRPRDASV